MDFRNIPAAQGSAGLRRNNPGNIRPGDSWKGMAGTDGGFVVFEDVTYGIRAQALNLYNNYYIHGLKSLSAFINKYAPASDGNDPVAYADQVAQATGIGIYNDMQLNEQKVAAIIRAMMDTEIGAQYAAMISQADLQQGVAMVGKFDMGMIRVQQGVEELKKFTVEHLPVVIIGTSIAISVYIYFITKNKKT